MHLFRWESVLLKQYGKGHLITIAENPEKARDKLRAEFDAWAKENREWAWQDAHATWGGEPDTTDLDELRAKFEADIAVEPTMHETLWINGSE